MLIRGRSRLFVALGTACSALLVVVLAGCADGKADAATASYCADFSDSIGVYAGNPVTQMGYRVGKVDSVTPAGDHVLVRFSLDGTRRFPADVKALTRSKTLLADRSVELVGNYVSGPQLRPGQCIPTDRAFTPQSISQIAGSAADFIQQLTPDNGDKSLQGVVSGMQQALAGEGPEAEGMMQHAAAAAQNPDKLVSDIGSTIQNMAPLTSTALDRWSAVDSIMTRLPDAVNNSLGLFPGVTKLVDGTGYVILTLASLQGHYGDIIWPTMDGPVSDVIHLAATRSKDMASLLESIPPVAQMMRRTAGADGNLTLTVQRSGPGGSGGANVLDLLLGKARS